MLIGLLGISKFGAHNGLALVSMMGSLLCSVSILHDDVFEVRFSSVLPPP